MARQYRCIFLKWIQYLILTVSLSAWNGSNEYYVISPYPAGVRSDEAGERGIFHITICLDCGAALLNRTRVEATRIYTSAFVHIAQSN